MLQSHRCQALWVLLLRLAKKILRSSAGELVGICQSQVLLLSLRPCGHLEELTPGPINTFSIKYVEISRNEKCQTRSEVLAKEGPTVLCPCAAFAPEPAVEQGWVFCFHRPCFHLTAPLLSSWGMSVYPKQPALACMPSQGLSEAAVSFIRSSCFI